MNTLFFNLFVNLNYLDSWEEFKWAIYWRDELSTQRNFKAANFHEAKTSGGEIIGSSEEYI